MAILSTRLTAGTVAGWLAMATLCGGSAAAEEAWRCDFGDMARWQAQSSWLGSPAQDPVAEAREGVGRFAITEPGRGMKWLLNLDEPVETELAPWLVVRYRATGFDAERADYLLWVKDNAANRDGVKLVSGAAVKADGQWHTQAFELAPGGVGSQVSALAIQCLARPGEEAEVLVSDLSLTDLPPADAEGYTPPVADGREWPVEVIRAEDWTVKPGWLGNYEPTSTCEATEAGLRFGVPLGGRGAKWARDLAEPITGAQWVALRYRARALQGSPDYALYVAAQPGGQALQEQYLIRLSDLVADGGWHVVTGRLAVPEVRTLAVQVQAMADGASLEIGGLRFTEARPVVRTVDVVDARVGWEGTEGGRFRPVNLPAGDLSGDELAARLGLSGWLPEGKVTVGGVPFTLRGGRDAALRTPLREAGAIEVPLSGQAAELYLVLGAQLPSADEPSFGGGQCVVRQMERLRARIEYADGTSEEQMPLAVAANEHAISRGIQVYALATEPGKGLGRLVLEDGMARGSFALVALTASEVPGPASEATAMLRAAPPVSEKPIESRGAGLRRTGNQLWVEAWSVTLGLEVSPGLRVIGAQNHSGVGMPLAVADGPLFRFTGENLDLTSEDFELVSCDLAEGQTSGEAQLELRCDKVTPPVTVSLQVDVTDPREIGLQARYDLGGRNASEVHFVFPELSRLGFEGPADDLWVWCPRRGDVITNASLSLREPYAGAGNPLQIMGAFSPRAGSGLYLMTQDMEAEPRFYLVGKSGAEARLGVEYWPAESGRTPRTVVGCLQGDWHAQLERYKEWVANWYTPAAPRKAWFREVFNFRQQFMHFELPSKSGMFDPETKTLRLNEVVQRDAELFGGVDYLHLFDWGWDPVHGRCGDYEPWDYLGGAEAFRRAVEEVRASGIPVGLYLEGILVDPQSNLGKAHGADWQMLDAAGKPYTYFAPSYHICARVPQWQDYLSGTYGRVQAETGAVGFYIDEYGFSGPSYLCYNPAHGHPLPVTPVRGEREMTRRVREALGPQAAIYTEESPTDVNSQYQDGSFTYNISSAPDSWSATHVNLYRFALPEFKTIEIICCDQPLGTNEDAVKRVLFNGEAIWLEGIADRWFAPAVRERIARYHRVLRENRECFTSNCPQPLVPTLVEGIYANEFPQREDRSGKTCWTVYNTGYRTREGEMLAVGHTAGATYRDELSGEALEVRPAGEQAYLRLRLGPREVTVVSRTVPAL